ncbi:MAG: tetratricopeptide repeat protein [Cytophagales bacterium]|nr:tetratricopeptide repeat protein [Cytophagales bacterium]
MFFKCFTTLILVIPIFSCLGQNLKFIRELEQQLDTTSTKDQWEVMSELAMEYASSDSALAWNYYHKAFRDESENLPRKRFTKSITAGFLFHKAGQSDSALYYFESALSTAEQLEDNPLKVKALEHLASVNMRSGNTVESVKQLKEGIVLAEELEDSLSLFGLTANLAIAYQTLTNYDSAIVCYLKGATYCENHPIYDCAMLYNNMGITYQDQGEYEKAESYNYKALKVRSEALDSIGIADSYINIAGVHWYKGQIDSATFYVNRAYDIYLDRQYVRGQSLCLNNLGAVYNYQGKYNAAIDAYEKSISLHKKTLDRENLGVAYFNIAEPYLALKKYQQVLTYLDSALTVAGKVGSKMILRETYNLQSRAYEQMGQIRDAWNSKELYHSYKDSITIESTDRQVAELETKFETEEKERKINEQELQLAQQELKIQRNGWITGSVIVFSLFIIIMVLLQRNRQKLKSKQEMAEQRKRLLEQQIDAVVNSVEKERRRFSEDLHDGFGQYISLIRQKVDQLNVPTPQSKKESIYNESEKLLKEMGNELKNICFNLMPRTLIQQGLDAALNEYLFRINSGRKIATEYIPHGVEGQRFKDVTEINLYRVCQEWTNNIMKYANARKLSVQLVLHEDQINLTIEDDGDGFDKQAINQSTGNGWKNIQSRINLMNGELLVDSTPGIKGTTFIVDVPMVSIGQNQAIREITEA